MIKTQTFDPDDFENDCPDCDGEGQYLVASTQDIAGGRDVKCDACDGSGKREED